MDTFSKPPKRKNPVTLIAGIVCKDGIVVAADGQTTKGNAKFLGANKISGVEFKNAKALVAEAGAAPLSAAAIEIFKRTAADQTVENDLTIAKTCEKAMREVVSSFTQHLGPKNSDQERQDFLYQSENYFELMVAYYHGFKPHIYLLKSTYCVPFPMAASAFFTTTGIGSDLANYILKEHASPTMKKDLASIIAIKTVKDVAENIEGCGLPVRIATISKPYRQRPYDVVPKKGMEHEAISLGQRVYCGEAEIVPSHVEIADSKKVEEFSKIISKVEQNSKESRNKKLHNAIQSQIKAYFRNAAKEWAAFCKEYPERAAKVEAQLAKTGQAYEILPDEQ